MFVNNYEKEEWNKQRNKFLYDKYCFVSGSTMNKYIYFLNFM